MYLHNRNQSWKKSLDPKFTRWWRPVQHRLTTWTHGLLGKRVDEYRVVLEEGDRIGYEDSESRIIKVNPQSFKEENPTTQYRLIQTILGLELGHALFTNDWPELPALRQTGNILEGERIEAAVQNKYPGLYNGFRHVEQIMLNKSEPFEDQEPKHRA
jgi:hypothetical protein